MLVATGAGEPQFKSTADPDDVVRDGLAVDLDLYVEKKLAPALVERSRLRETRGVNDVKRGLNAIGGGYEGATFDAVLPACPRAAARRLASAAAEEEGDEGDAPGAEAWEYDAAER